MLVSLKELSKYVDLNGISVKEIADRLTFSGIEVEEISSLASGTNLVIGEIIECVSHPDSDHLHVLKVNLGPKYGVEQIVCGAPNARKGLKVIVSRVGAKLPGGEIKKSAIRGVESNGMCCSLLELGVDSKYLSENQTKGIEELPLDAVVGNEEVLSYLGLDDTVLLLNVLANRPDLLSIYNVAREVGAIFERKVNIPLNNVKETFKTNLTVNSLTPSCMQFSAREVKGIKVKESPSWLKASLEAMGIRSINNIVDIGNYVMLLTGQPLHMYDADKLPKAELSAISGFEGDFVALDEKTYKVNKDDIVISSNKEAMCLGGVMGALKCAVDEKTTHVYIESASFLSKCIRHTSSRLGLVSESSQRFVKGTNHYQAQFVLDFASKLLIDLATAKEVSNIVNYQKEEKPLSKVSSSLKRINDRLGTSFTYNEVKSVLNRLNFEVNDGKNDEFIVTIPSYRLDISCDADISEEVIRILGFRNVPSTLPTLQITVGGRTLSQTRLKAIREYLLDIGLDECITYSLVNKESINAFNLLHNDEPYQVMNPITEEHEYFRTHLLDSLVKVAGYNINRQNKDLALFETSHVTSKKNAATNLAIVLVGKSSLRGKLKTSPYDFYSIKGIVEGLFSLLGIEKSRYKFVKPVENLSLLHPGKSADIIFQNQLVGRCGELHPNLYKKYDLGKTNAVVLEMNLNMLLEAKVSINKMSNISRFPTISRDLALVVDKSISALDLIRSIKTTGKGIVKEANIFDVYEGDNLLPSKKSIAISITFGNDDHTLTDKEINDVLDRIKFELTRAYKAELRS